MLHANTLCKSNCDVVSSNCVKTRYTIAISILDLVIYDVRDLLKLIGLLATSTRRLTSVASWQLIDYEVPHITSSRACSL